MDLSIFPAINAGLNGLCSSLLVLGWWLARQGKKKAHIATMSTALFCSAIFLTSYLYYHHHAGATKFTEEGFVRVIYFFILGTHTPLAALIVPFIIAAVVAAVRGRLEMHRRLVRWVLPTWLYVSVTGVLIYMMLYQWFPPVAP